MDPAGKSASIRAKVDDLVRMVKITQKEHIRRAVAQYVYETYLHLQGEIMYERFTDQVRKVMQLANQEAQRCNHEFISSEHILLGILKEGSGVVTTALKSIGMDLRVIQSEIEKTLSNRSGSKRVVMGRLPYTTEAKQIINAAIEQARSRNQNHVSVEHIFAAIIDSGLCADFLKKHGLSSVAQFWKMVEEIAPTLVGSTYMNPVPMIPDPVLVSLLNKEDIMPLPPPSENEQKWPIMTNKKYRFTPDWKLVMDCADPEWKDRVVNVHISYQDVLNCLLLHHGNLPSCLHRLSLSSIPKDVEVLSVREDPFNRRFVFTLRHPTFPVHLDGEVLPVLPREPVLIEAIPVAGLTPGYVRQRVDMTMSADGKTITTVIVDRKVGEVPAKSTPHDSGICVLSEGERYWFPLEWERWVEAGLREDHGSDPTKFVSNPLLSQLLKKDGTRWEMFKTSAEAEQWSREQRQEQGEDNPFIAE